MLRAMQKACTFFAWRSLFFAAGSHGCTQGVLVGPLLPHAHTQHLRLLLCSAGGDALAVAGDDGATEPASSSLPSEWEEREGQAWLVAAEAHALQVRVPEGHSSHSMVATAVRSLLGNCFAGAGVSHVTIEGRRGQKQDLKNTDAVAAAAGSEQCSSSSTSSHGVPFGCLWTRAPGANPNGFCTALNSPPPHNTRHRTHAPTHPPCCRLWPLKPSWPPAV